ncbi:glycosyltransferase family 2 protein [Lacihabitans sp. LS3-19]|uniref:glycosyltransferase family 2 protein n=1 Tax=Lacihabitans sp. LS3-19 TaxID=2487335 RepID=UPI0020CC8E9F|nr:glycosyltransferase family 2 protein [Lacihabitans sp. LS3-19]MCP9770894.1 glycosyltransferase family 2 protein [Lacihabitans sp. LS3-19]
MKSTAVVILNFNGIDFLNQFLGNVVENSPEADIFVIDNYSSDNSVTYIKEQFPLIGIIQNAKNLGFAGGYNEGLKQVSHENLVLLNSDVELSPNWLKYLIERSDKTENIAAIQPKILDFKRKNYFEYAGAAGGFLDTLGYSFCRGRVFDTLEEDHGQYQTSTEIFWASGACFFIKNKIFKELGGFDDKFFAHMEEIDLCWRIQNHGFQIVYEPQSVVYHVGGGTLNKSNPFKTFLNFRNNLAMLFKNLPFLFLLPIIFFRLILDGVSAFKFLKDGNSKDFWAVAKAHFAFYGMIPYLIKQRKGSFVGFKKLSKGSVVWKYFVKNQKTYPEICSK